MIAWGTIGALAGAGTVALTAAVVGLGHARWSRTTGRLLERMEAAAAPAEGTFDPAQLEGLPAPVARYFGTVLRPGQVRVREARLRQEGTFALRPDRWSPFTATETFTVQPPGFVWEARIAAAPLVGVHVRDSYVAGTGTMHGELAAVATVVDQHGTPEMAAGALLRWLAEAPWLPTALLPPAVAWDAIDDTTARASVTDAGTTVSMDVHFAADGGIARITALRHRDVNGTSVLTTWEGRFSDYTLFGGMRIPRRGSVGWIVAGVWEPYWHGTITDAAYLP